MSRGIRIVLGASLGLVVGACFSSPTGAVLFSCDPDTAPECPPGYVCQPDGCCHDEDDADWEQTAGDCSLAGVGQTEGPLTGGLTSSGSGTGTGTGTGSGSGTGSGTESDGPGTTDSTDSTDSTGATGGGSSDSSSSDGSSGSGSGSTGSGGSDGSGSSGSSGSSGG